MLHLHIRFHFIFLQVFLIFWLPKAWRPELYGASLGCGFTIISGGANQSGEFFFGLLNRRFEKHW